MSFFVYRPKILWRAKCSRESKIFVGYDNALARTGDTGLSHSLILILKKLQTGKVRCGHPISFRTPKKTHKFNMLIFMYKPPCTNIIIKLYAFFFNYSHHFTKSILIPNRCWSKTENIKSLKKKLK